MKHIDIKQVEAKARNEEHNALTTQQKLSKIDDPVFLANLLADKSP